MRIAMTALALFMLSITSNAAWAQASFHFYAGPASPTPLLDIVKARNVQFDALAQLSIGADYRLFGLGKYFDSGVELTLSKHTDSWSAFSGSTAFWSRWKLLPWSHLARSGFKAGAGVSYATEPLLAETLHIAPTSKLLLHVLLEFDVYPFGENSPWGFLFRVHHRSGVFGLVDGVIGGSDFICLGVRYSPQI